MEKRERLEAKLNEIGLENYCVFGTFEGEVLPCVWGDGTKIIDTILGALEKDWKLRSTFIGMLQGIMEQQIESQGMSIPRGWKGQA